MDRQQFISYIEDPGLLNSESLNDVTSLARRFPYCQSLQILQLLNLHQTNEVLYDEYLSLTAAHIADRRRLKELIRSLKAKSISEEDESVESVKSVESVGSVEPAFTEVSADKSAELVEGEEEDRQGKPDEPFRNIEPIVPVVEDDEKERLLRLKKIVEQRLRQIALEKSELPEPEEPILSKDELIDKFIEEEPSISRPKPEFFDPVKVARSSQEEHPGLVTETLARIHVQQGNINKAIEIYRRLSLNFPEKSSYFAAQIEKLSTEN